VAQWDPYQNDKSNVDKKVALTALSDYLAKRGKNSIETSTQILILPGYQFKIIDGLITNFHQPQSTLLLLIAAILGEEWKTVYQHALTNKYRFLSYGDSNLYWI
jgi:S-adenosylmethionine:tRNA ribosyltransferase-isomerase